MDYMNKECKQQLPNLVESLSNTSMVVMHMNVCDDTKRIPNASCIAGTKSLLWLSTYCDTRLELKMTMASRLSS